MEAFDLGKFVSIDEQKNVFKGLHIHKMRINYKTKMTGSNVLPSAVMGTLRVS
jgi:hypothetical protein